MKCDVWSMVKYVCCTWYTGESVVKNSTRHKWVGQRDKKKHNTQYGLRTTNKQNKINRNNSHAIVSYSLVLVSIFVSNGATKDIHEMCCSWQERVVHTINFCYICYINTNTDTVSIRPLRKKNLRLPGAAWAAHKTPQ